MIFPGQPLNLSQNPDQAVRVDAVCDALAAAADLPIGALRKLYCDETGEAGVPAGRTEGWLVGQLGRAWLKNQSQGEAVVVVDPVDVKD